MFKVESLDFFTLTLRECKFYHLYANFTRSLKEIEKKSIKIGKKKQNSVYSSIYMIVCVQIPNYFYVPVAIGKWNF